jgi:hypothetical protein
MEILIAISPIDSQANPGSLLSLFSADMTTLCNRRARGKLPWQLLFSLFSADMTTLCNPRAREKLPWLLGRQALARRAAEGRCSARRGVEWQARTRRRVAP